MNAILESARKIQDELIAIRREIHKNPEVGDKTSDYENVCNE